MFSFYTSVSFGKGGKKQACSKLDEGRMGGEYIILASKRSHILQN